jgi:hypothetical protein
MLNKISALLTKSEDTAPDIVETIATPVIKSNKPPCVCATCRQIPALKPAQIISQ